MKTVAFADAAKDLQSLLNLAQKEKVVILRRGKVSAIIIGLESYDAEDWELAQSRDFWRMIQKRRRERRFTTLEEVKSRLEKTRPRASAKRKPHARQ